MHKSFAALFAILMPVQTLAGPPQVSLTQLECKEASQLAQRQIASPEIRLTWCPSGSDLRFYIATGPNISWPMIMSHGAITSFEDFMLDAIPGEGKGLLYFAPASDSVWRVSVKNRLSAFVVSLSGNDPVRLAPATVYLTVPTGLARTPSFHETLDQALEHVLTKGE